MPPRMLHFALIISGDTAADHFYLNRSGPNTIIRLNSFQAPCILISITEWGVRRG